LDADRASVSQALMEAIARLGEDDRTFSIIEFGEPGVTVWAVRVDGNGTPYARTSKPLVVPPLTDPVLFYKQKLSPLIETGSRLLLVRSSDDYRSGDAFEAFHAAHAALPCFVSARPVETELREAIRDSPLTRWYELVVLRQTPSGRLGLSCHPLFPPGAERGYSEQVRVKCEPAGEYGTVFAVVTREGSQLRPVSIQSAVIAADTYRVTAVLNRPGQVRFDGLPAALKGDPRSWHEIVAAVPKRLDHLPPTHLICLIEVGGRGESIRRRIDRVEQLIRTADAGDSRLAVSLVTYGPHAYDHRQHEESAAVLGRWAASGAQALSALRELGNRRQPADEYPRAAQLECALNQVAGRISDRNGRPVLVTVGSRPAFPPRRDLRTEILPCPRRRDWRWPLQQLEGMPDISFGALYNGDTGEEIWSRLGREALESVDVADMNSFATDLGLRGSVQCVPFPLIDLEGT